MARARRRPWILRALAAPLLLLMLGAAVLIGVWSFPQPLFAHHRTVGVYDVWSDRPIPVEIQVVLADATRRLRTSELWTPEQRFRIFFCNDSWRLALFSQQFASGMGGVADTWLSRNVYLRESDIAHNRLIPAHPWRATMADRPLSYYVAHELTHVMESRAFGPGTSVRFPRWINEGYADLIGKGGQFDVARNTAALRRGDREMNPKASGLYRLYHLEVAHVLARPGWDVRRLYATPPPEAQVRAELLQDPPT